MQEREPVDETRRRAAKKKLFVIAVALALGLVAWGYVFGSMLGLWAGSDWMTVLAVVMTVSFIGLGRLSR